mmetsp:Transcript_8014/g.18149  ORF Transcript_8014/g.18149 Transcript_8014/m.18149 type:complete len:237 (+) Transcript_8014:1739-2449(+)
MLLLTDRRRRVIRKVHDGSWRPREVEPIHTIRCSQHKRDAIRVAYETASWAQDYAKGKDECKVSARIHGINAGGGTTNHLAHAQRFRRRWGDSPAQSKLLVKNCVHDWANVERLEIGRGPASRVGEFPVRVHDESVRAHNSEVLKVCGKPLELRVSRGTVSALLPRAVRYLDSHPSDIHGNAERVCDVHCDVPLLEIRCWAHFECRGITQCGSYTIHSRERGRAATTTTIATAVST